MPRRTDISSILIIGAAVATPGLATPAAMSSAPQDCTSRVVAFTRKNAIEGYRLLFTFTGTQDALLPLWEGTSAPSVETSLFPIDRGTFVATITVRVRTAKPWHAEAWAAELCRFLPPTGARYNGAIAHRGNDMVDADMSEPALSR